MKILVVENGNEIYTSEEMLDLAKDAMSKEKNKRLHWKSYVLQADKR